ncbi:MAG TPA: (2Fe-2S) ferredoxin domain-containing protein [Pyrinomonadaceae bacterium]|nr:(2Fe-2S) ferredoxin domain-containing protein [Pyrinomonadaceae bacterium]
MGGLKKIKAHVLVCENKDCERRGGREAYKALKESLRERGVRGRVLVTKVDCLDQCDDGPVMAVYPEGVWYGRVDAACAREIAARLAGEGASSSSPRAGACRVLHVMRAQEVRGDEAEG